MSSRLSSRLRDRGKILRASVAAACESLESRRLLTAAPVMNPGGAPNGPYNLALAAPQPTLVSLAFTDNANNETGFVIERAPGSGAGPLVFTPIATLPPSPAVGSVVTFSDTAVDPNTTYSYRVHAINGTYDSSTAGPQAITTPANSNGTGGGGIGTPNPGGPPNGPYNISVADTAGGPRISFVDNATNETNLVVQRASSTAGPWSNVAALPPSPGSGQTVSVIDTVAAPAGSTVFYRAFAVNGPYQSSIAGPVPFTFTSVTPTFTGVPNGPYNLIATATSSTSVQLHFINNANNESHFIIERATTAGFSSSTLTELPQVAAVGQQVTFNDTGLTANTTYFYRVFAANDVHLSGPSGTTSVLTPLAASTAQYGLDASFGTDGHVGVATPFNALTDIGAGVQPDGQIVVGGFSGNSFTLTRYTAAGVPEINFGNGGMSILQFTPGSTAKNIAIQPDGKIVIAGFNDSFGQPNATLLTERLNANGTFDPNFGVGGIVTTVIPTFTSLSDISVAIAADGNIAVGGIASPPFTGLESVFAVRLGETGMPDSSFGNGGIATSLIGGIPGNGSPVIVALHDIAVGPADQIAVVGTTVNLDNNKPVLVAFDANGNEILHATSIPAPEKYRDAIPGAKTETITAVAIQTDGKTVIAGTANGANGYVARYNADGSLDASFGNGGVVDSSTDPSLYLTSLSDLRLQPDGRILIGGVGRNTAAAHPAAGLPTTAATNFYFARLNSNGSFDTTFSPSGVIATAASGGSIDAISLAPDGGIVAVGDGGSLLARYIPGGTGGFIGGVPNGPFNLTAISQATNSITLQFFDNSTNETSFEIDRASFSGNHRGDFSPLATVAAQPGIGPVTFVDTSATPGLTYQYEVRAVDGPLASAEVVSSAVTTLNGNTAANGAARLDPSFGRNGVAFNFDLPGAAHAGVQPGGKIIVEGVQSGFVYLARYNTNGTLDNSFGANGVLSTNFNGGLIPSLGIQSDGKIIIAGGGFGQNNFQDGNPTSAPTSALAERFTVDGMLDSSFGTDGAYRVPFIPTFENGVVSTIAVAADDRIAIINSVMRDLSIPPSLPEVIVLTPDGKQTINYTTSASPPFTSINQKAAAFGPGDSLTVVGDVGNALFGTRYQPVGSAAPSGSFILPAGASASTGLGTAVQGDGEIVAVGSADASALIARFNNDLTPDAGFALGGLAETVAPPAGRDLAAVYGAVLIQPDGSILAAGQFKRNGTVNGDLLLSRFASNGALDHTFASDGSIATDVGANDDQITSLVREPDGTIVGVGVAFGNLVLIKYDVA